MRFSKLVILGLLLIAAGVLLVYQDQTRGRTRACESRVRKAATAFCKWTYLGETKVWMLEFDENEELFTELKRAMLKDLQVPREEGTSASVPEFQVCIRDRKGQYPFDFNVFAGRTIWVECGGGTYQSKGHTHEFLRRHLKNFVPSSGNEATP